MIVMIHNTAGAASWPFKENELGKQTAKGIF